MKIKEFEDVTLEQLEGVVVEYGGKAATPDELYTELFHIGEHYIQRTGEYRAEGSKDFKGNPMIYVNDDEKYKGKMKRYILLEDTLLEQLEEARQMPSNLLNAVSYYGRKKDKEHADRCFGLIFDIDKITPKTLNAFLHGCFNFDIYPLPNYLVFSKSGHGMHLYYIFDEPLRLYPKIKTQLKTMKYELIRKLWNPYTSTEENIQYQSFDQSFMVAGTTENMKVFKLNERKWEIKEFEPWTTTVFEQEELWHENQYTLEEAKARFPEWYEKVIVNDDHSKGHWICKRAVYDWWLDKIMSGATYGHRYWCTMMLVIYAVKCGVPYDEVKKTAYDLIPFMNSINPDEPFMKDDVKSALECYDSQFATFPIDDISRLSNIEIQKNKRNGRKQSVHLEGARAIQAINDRANGTNWREGNGRPSAQQTVVKWRQLHPEGRPKDCIAETGLNKNTVYKWWKS